MKYHYDNEYSALYALLDHVQLSHPEYYTKLQKRGRQLAMCQNGCGYSDDGETESKTSGWSMASATFRKAWTRAALRESLEEKSHTFDWNNL